MFKRRISSVIPSILNGQAVESSKKVPLLSHNSEILHYYSPLDRVSERIPRICEDSYTGFLNWSSTSGEKRKDILLTAASLIQKNSQQYIEAHTEIGGSEAFARFNVEGAISSIKEYASCISRPNGALLKSQTDLAFSIQTPIGPVLSIAPWNAPVILWTRAIMAPLAAGCSVVMKATEKAPKVPYLLTKHLLEAGVDNRALQLFHLEHGQHKLVTEQFLANDRIRKVNFTGSTAVGRQIAQVAAKYLKPSLLELGGKNLSFVLKDADLQRAAADSVFSAWFHMGQICMSLDTVFVHEDVYDEFVKCLKDEAKKLILNPDFSMNQRDKSGADKVNSLVSDALKKGAHVIFKGNSDGEGRCNPIILGDVTSEMAIGREETFGPCLSVYKFRNIDTSIQSANGLKYGLKASIWSSDIISAISLAKSLEAGGVHINGSTIHDEATVPHGGVKDSGTGRFSSIWGINEFCFTKSITVSK